MKKPRILLVLLIGIAFWPPFWGEFRETIPTNVPAKAGIGLDSLQNSVRFVALGDVVMHLPIVNSCRQPDGTYNFRPIFAELKTTLDQADFATCVLETPLAGPAAGYTGYPAFNAPDAIADGLQWAGIDLVFTAHNHSLDRGWSGMKATMSYLERIALSQVGLRGTPAQPRYLIVKVKNMRIAFLSYTTTTNGILLPENREWAVNRFNYLDIAKDIKAVNRSGADCIVMALHTGVEYQRLPSPEQQQMMGRLLQMGVDIVIGSHVHVVEPWEGYRLTDPVRNRMRNCFAVYSLGNLLSNQRWRFSDCGLMITFELQKKPDGGVNIITVTPTPLWVNRYLEEGRFHYRIVTISSPQKLLHDPTLDAIARSRIHEVWMETFQLWEDWRQGRFGSLFRPAGTKTINLHP